MLDFQGKLLKRAAEICGGYGALCERLDVTSSSLRAWAEGRTRLPSGVFLKAADIVLEDDIARADQDRRSNPRPLPARELAEPTAGHA